jgi:hypothetical protein
MVLAVVDVLAWLGATVLVVAGALKLVSPLPAARFLLALRLPAAPLAVRVVAALEIAAGTAVLAFGAPAALAAAGALYASFLAALAGHSLRTGERTVSCGCFGSGATVAVLPHAAALALMLAATAVAAFAGREPLASVVASVAPTEAVLLLALLAVAVAAALGYSTAGSSAGAPELRTAPRAGAEFTLTIERRGD